MLLVILIFNFLVGGNVGIGTTDVSTYKLNVNGNVNVSNVITTRGMELIPSVITTTVPSTITSTPAFTNFIYIW